MTNTRPLNDGLEAFAQAFERHGMETGFDLTHLYREMLIDPSRLRPPADSFSLFEHVQHYFVPTKALINYDGLLDCYAQQGDILQKLDECLRHVVKLKMRSAIERWESYMSSYLHKVDKAPIIAYIAEELDRNVYQYYPRCLVNVHFRNSNLILSAEYTQRETLAQLYGEAHEYKDRPLGYHSSGLAFELPNLNQTQHLFIYHTIDRKAAEEAFLGDVLAHQRLKKLNLLLS